MAAKDVSGVHPHPINIRLESMSSTFQRSPMKSRDIRGNNLPESAEEAYDPFIPSYENIITNFIEIFSKQRTVEERDIDKGNKKQGQKLGHSLP